MPQQNRVHGRTITGQNGYIKICIPQALKTHLEVEQGDRVHLMKEEGEHGKYISIWNPDAQEEGEE